MLKISIKVDISYTKPEELLRGRHDERVGVLVPEFEELYVVLKQPVIFTSDQNALDEFNRALTSEVP